MANRLKLNEKVLRDAEPQEGNSYQIFDTEIRGLAAKVQPSGNRTFTLDYRFAGRQRRLTIGRWPEWSVTAARERARELRRMSVGKLCNLSPASRRQRQNTGNPTRTARLQRE
jgi:hypothetical protein